MFVFNKGTTVYIIEQVAALLLISHENEDLGGWPDGVCKKMNDDREDVQWHQIFN